MAADLTQPTWTTTVNMTNLSTSSSDNTAVLAAYLNAAAPYTKFIVADGTYTFSQNIDITVPNVGIFSASNNPAACVFSSTSQTQHGYRVLAGATNHWLKGITHTVVRSSGTARGSLNEQGEATLLVETGVAGFRGEDCVFSNAVAASAFFYGCTDYQLNRCTVQGSLADGFHSTNGSHGGRFYDCQALNTGDDGFAVVQYGSDSAAQVSYDIQFIRPYSLNSAARGISAICVHDITIQDPTVTNSYSPGIYIAREGNNTNPEPCYNIYVTGTAILTNCCTGTDQGSNGPFFLLNSDNTATVYNVTVANAAIVNTPTTNNGCVRALTYSSGVITATLNNFKFYGTTPTSGGLPQVFQNVAGTQSTITTNGWEGLTAGVNGNYSGTVHPASQAPTPATAPTTGGTVTTATATVTANAAVAGSTTATATVVANAPAVGGSTTATATVFAYGAAEFYLTSSGVWSPMQMVPL